MSSTLASGSDPSADAPADRPAETSLRAALQGLVLVAPVTALVIGGWAYRWIVDDGFIYLRVVDQLLDGNGPVFNAGERVEVFTSPVWVGVLSVTDLLLPLRLEWIAVLGGITLSAVGLGLAIAGSRLLVRRETADAFLVPFGALVLVALVPMWIFQSSGLESGLVFGWLGACVYLLARWSVSSRRLPYLAAVVLGLGWTVRPELVLLSAIAIVAVVAVQWSEDSWPARLGLVGAAIAIPVAYQVFRMGYYGMLVANPAVAKNASSTNWARGWDYLVDFVRPYGLWLMVALVAAGGYIPMIVAMRRDRAVRAVAATSVFVLAAVAHTVYIVAVGGDWLHARLLLPALFMLAGPVAVVPATRRYAAAALIVPWALVAAFVLRPHQLGDSANIADQFVLGGAGRSDKVTLDDFGWGDGGPNLTWFEGPAFYYSNGLQRDFQRVVLEEIDADASLPTIATGGIGKSGYALPDAYILDLHGLSSTLASHLVSTPSTTFLDRKPGHEKVLPSPWIAALMTPDGERVHDEDYPALNNPSIPLTTGDEFQTQTEWARAALACDEVRDLFEATTERLTPGRFLSNIFGSVSRTRLTIPPDPETAYRTLCDPSAEVPPPPSAVD